MPCRLGVEDEKRVILELIPRPLPASSEAKALGPDERRGVREGERGGAAWLDQ